MWSIPITMDEHIKIKEDLNIMTIPEKIMVAVATIKNVDRTIFTKNDIRLIMELKPEQWNVYGCVFQGMITEPKRGPRIPYFLNVFKRVSHGHYILTDHGKEQIKKFVR